MGRYLWDEKMIRFMDQAAERSAYYKELASYIEPYISRDSVVCDVGCGLGYLAAEMSRFCKKVYAVDISEQVIDCLKLKLEKENITNVEALCVDVFNWKPREQIDATVYCMFGTLDEIEMIGKHLGVKQQFIVRRLAKQHRFRIKEKREHRYTAQEMMEELYNAQYTCDYYEMAIHFDQPFRNLEEAVQFFEIYNKSQEKISLEDVKNRIEEQDDEEYPYLLPSEKQMGLICYKMK